MRGAGQPQGVFVMERLLDRVARELGLDRAELRRRNLIGPSRMPCTRPLKARGGLSVVLDSGDYPACQDMALAAAGWTEFPARQNAARAAGRYLGIGVANFVKGTGRGPFESVRVSIGPSGSAQCRLPGAARRWGRARAPCWPRSWRRRSALLRAGGSVEVTTGDTAAIALGHRRLPTAAKRCLAGSSEHRAAALAVRDKALLTAAHLLEAAAVDLELCDGVVRVRGAPQMKVAVAEIARALGGSAGFALPSGMAPGLESLEHVVIDAMTYANGTAVAEIEVDPETGQVDHPAPDPRA